MRMRSGVKPVKRQRKSGPMRRRRLNLRQACATASPQRCGVSLNATATLSFSVLKFIRNGPDKGRSVLSWHDVSKCWFPDFGIMHS